MHVLSVVGADAATRTVTDRLASHLGRDGRVAVLRRAEAGDSARDAPESATVHDAPETATYEVAADGWRASGRDRSVSDLLDDLAPDYDYAILIGFPDADAPRVVVDEDRSGGDLGGEVPSGETLVAEDGPADVDPAEVRAKLDATEPYETLESLVAEAKRSEDAPYSGAIATFTGRVRAKDEPEDEPTERLEFEKYEGVAEERMEALAAELEERDGVFEVVMHHRTGVIEYGEDIVFVVVLAGHRGEAFRTVEDGIDRLKEEVPIFKKEVTTDEQFWVHERS
ncbi:molybdopterin synthase [Halorussus litoreus]|uniref:molybdopterin synthase n=1 Tax=Halorussus litoreus TaxID=1710536 RepID=UPI000E26EAA0|nr:molybdopterin synthase [Halorussus litoreus]